MFKNGSCSKSVHRLQHKPHIKIYNVYKLCINSTADSYMEHFLMCIFNEKHWGNIVSITSVMLLVVPKFAGVENVFEVQCGKWNRRQYFWKIFAVKIGVYHCMLLLYSFVYFCKQLYWYVTSHKWIPGLMTNGTVKHCVLLSYLQCTKWASEKCRVCKSFHAWADKKVSALLLI
jgi:hypothetical protein